MADFTMQGDGGVTIAVQSKSLQPIARLAMRVKHRLGSVELIDIDRGGRIYVLAENIPENVNDEAYSFVARFSANGGIERVY